MTMEKQVTVSRIFDASPEELWKIWTEPEYVKQWWGPDKFTCPLAEIHFKEGSTSLVCMQAPPEFGGQASYSIWTYTKIVPFECIEFIQNLANEKGAKQKPTALGMPPDFPPELHTTVTFKARGTMTELTITEESWTMGQMYVYSYAGTQQMIDKLAAYLGEEA